MGVTSLRSLTGSNELPVDVARVLGAPFSEPRKHSRLTQMPYKNEAHVGERTVRFVIRHSGFVIL